MAELNICGVLQSADKKCIYVNLNHPFDKYYDNSIRKIKKIGAQLKKKIINIPPSKATNIIKIRNPIFYKYYKNNTVKNTCLKINYAEDKLKLPAAGALIKIHIVPRIYAFVCPKSHNEIRGWHIYAESIEQLI